jgi:hypothetical protein
MMGMQYDVKQAHLNGSGIFVVGPTRIKGVSLTGTATAGQLIVFDTLTAPVTTGTYGRSGTTVTVTQSAHGLANGQVIGIDFAAGTGGTATNGNYAVTVLTSSTFTITDINSGSITAGAAMVYSTGKWLMTYDVAAGDTYNNAPFIPAEGVRADTGVYGYITNLAAANIYYG